MVRYKREHSAVNLQQPEKLTVTLKVPRFRHLLVDVSARSNVDFRRDKQTTNKQQTNKQANKRDPVWVDRHGLGKVGDTDMRKR